jgi:hypothetical protein
VNQLESGSFGLSEFILSLSGTGPVRLDQFTVQILFVGFPRFITMRMVLNRVLRLADYGPFTIRVDLMERNLPAFAGPRVPGDRVLFGRNVSQNVYGTVGP